MLSPSISFGDRGSKRRRGPGKKNVGDHGHKVRNNWSRHQEYTDGEGAGDAAGRQRSWEGKAQSREASDEVPANASKLRTLESSKSTIDTTKMDFFKKIKSNAINLSIGRPQNKSNRQAKTLIAAKLIDVNVGRM